MIQAIIFGVLALLTARNPTNDTEIKLDGLITKEEWLGAKEYKLSTGEPLYILYQDQSMYIGIKANLQGWAHVYLQHEGQVIVLHASAALGKQIYKLEGDAWKLQEKFNWELRDVAYDEKLKQKQTEYLNKNGWCANNSNAGDKKTLEFKIDLSKFGKDKARFAVLHTSDAKSISYYPQELSDNTLLKELVSGGAVDNLDFRTNTWVKVNYVD